MDVYEAERELVRLRDIARRHAHVRTQVYDGDGWTPYDEGQSNAEHSRRSAAAWTQAASDAGEYEAAVSRLSFLDRMLIHQVFDGPQGPPSVRSYFGRCRFFGPHGFEHRLTLAGLAFRTPELVFACRSSLYGRRSKTQTNLWSPIALSDAEITRFCVESASANRRALLAPALQVVVDRWDPLCERFGAALEAVRAEADEGPVSRAA